MEINLTPTEIGTLFEKVEGVSYLTKFATVDYDSTADSRKTRYAQLDDARVHTAGKKTEGDDTLIPVSIDTKPIYKLMLFDDIYEQDELIERIKEQLPKILAKAIDQLPAGYLLDQSGNPVPTVIPQSSAVDGTAKSWTDVVDAQANSSFGVTGWVLDQKAKPLLREANSNSLSTLASSDLPQDFRVGEAPFGFHTKFSRGDDLGYVLDGAGTFLVIQPSIKLEVHSPSSDWTLREENKVGVYAGIRAGVGIAPGAARRIVKAPVKP